MSVIIYGAADMVTVYGSCVMVRVGVVAVDAAWAMITYISKRSQANRCRTFSDPNSSLAEVKCRPTRDYRAIRFDLRYVTHIQPDV